MTRDLNGKETADEAIRNLHPPPLTKTLWWVEGQINGLNAAAICVPSMTDYWVFITFEIII